MAYPNPHGPTCPWYSIAENQGAPNIKWCEETLCQWISEPANTWSNLGYMLIGIYILFITQKNNDNFKLKQFGPIVFFMGAMSFFYHLSNFYGSQVLDFVGMFFFVGWALGMNFIRLRALQEKHLIAFNLMIAIILTLAVHIMYLNAIKFQILVLLAGFVILITEIKANKKLRVDLGWFITAIVTIFIAFCFSIADGKRIWCHPEDHGLFSQGHALWHWIASLGMFAIYKHYSQPKMSPRD